MDREDKGDFLLKKVESTISEFHMLEEGDKVVVGVSGGPDSACLLHLLFSLRERYNFKLWAAHLNHCIRGKEAEEDEKWVKFFAGELGIPLICDSVNVPLLVKEKKLGLEAVARQVRYKFLEHVVNKVKAKKLALGHTASDQVETVLMRLIRGSGVDGLGGIPPKRGNIIRPLIKVFRWEIEEYCKRYGIIPRRDSSNKNTYFLRNKIRLELIPYLSANYNPRVEEVIYRTSELLRVERDFLDGITEKVKNKVVRKISGREIRLGIFALAKLHLCLQRRIVRYFLKKLKGDLEGIEYSHIEQILNLREKEGTKIVYLPGEIRVWREYEELVFKKGEKGEERVPYFFSYLNVPGKTEIEDIGLVFESEVLSEKPAHFPENPDEIFLDVDKISSPLYVRPRKEGDKFFPFGMKGKKKLKDFFIDLKVPKFERDRIPILVSGENIVWVVGYRMDDRFKVDGKTQRILHIKVYSNDS